MSGVVDRIDRFQERHPVVSFPLAVVYKFFDDQGNYLAATLTYYAFVAIFPLMLLGTSILGFVLEGRPTWQEDILDSALSQFPIIGNELGRPQGLSGSVSGVLVGSLAALYGILGLGQALQNTMHVVWSVPRNSRPNPIYSRVKSLMLFLTAGTSLLAVTIVSAVATTTDAFSQWVDTSLTRLLPLFTVLVVGCGLTALFRLAATGQHSFLRAAPGGFTLAVLWQLLQLVGAWYVSAVLVGTTSMTEIFGVVLGLIGFIYIGAVMAVLAMEVNVVIARQLYPRALLAPFTDNVHLTRADRRAYTDYARMQRHKGFERVEVVFAEPPAEDDGTGPHEGPAGAVDRERRPAATAADD